MSDLRKFIQQVIREARTKHPGDLSQAELIALVQYALDGSGVFDFTEKFAGSHAEILQRIESGEFASKSKAGRAAGSGWSAPAGKAKQISDQMASLSPPPASRRFAFEFIDTADRPDYINYLIGDQPVAVEYTGELTKEEADSLNDAQSIIKFISLDDIRHDAFSFTPDNLTDLADLSSRLESGKLKRAELRDVGSQVSAIIAGSISQSLLGGPIEGLIVHSADRMFKIPNPQYADVQRLQSPLYAMFSGRGGVSKKEIKSRIINADNEDRLLQDLKKYLESISELPAGFRTFFTADEGEDLLGLIDSAVSGDTRVGESLYVQLNRRINNKSSWINT
ncbi:MAG TPA: hypothetical protein EYG21_00715 [Nitrospinaceae bacterium]|jgi:hypothetical protein|nr:hypothetical protein [Nitrospinaceae bacterium]